MDKDEALSKAKTILDDARSVAEDVLLEAGLKCARNIIQLDPDFEGFIFLCNPPFKEAKKIHVFFGVAHNVYINNLDKDNTKQNPVLFHKQFIDPTNIFKVMDEIGYTII